MLFPLPLTPFEYYYLSDDRPEYPTTYPIDLRLSGELQREPLLTALRQALARHPLLDACIDDSGRAPQWVSSGGQDPAVDWGEHSTPISHPAGEYIDLRRNPGMRLWVRTGGGTSRALFQFHHACCDGLAAFRFVEDLFICYRLVRGGTDETPKLPEIDVESLKRRDRFAVVENYVPSLPEAVRDTWVTARVWSTVMLNRAALLAAPKALSNGRCGVGGNGALPMGKTIEQEAPRAILQYETASITSDQMRQLRRLARAQNASLNDVMLRDLFLAVCDWNQRQQGSSRGDFRVNVPVSLRDRTDRTMSAANRLSFAFVTKNERDCRDRRKLLAAVRQDIDQIKRWKLGLYFYGGLALASGIPSVVPWALKRKFPFATIVHSNLGRVYSHSALERGGRLQCGDVRLERLTGVPPLRPSTRGAIAIIQYGDEATINLRCDPHLFGTADTRALLDAYVGQLKETLRVGN